MRRTEIKRIALELYLKGFSLRKIQMILNGKGIGIHYSTIKRWLDGTLTLQNQKKIELPAELKGKIKSLLLLNNKEKGRTRTLSLSFIYKLLEVDLRLYGINSKTSWYRFIKGFIKEEFGSYEKLQKKRLDKRELSKNIISKGKLSRSPAQWEIDATGYSYNGKHYHIFIAKERYSGYFLDFFIKEVKEDTGTGYYNRAFSSLDIALFLMSLFERFGLPEVIITDNEPVLRTELVKKGLQKLNIKHRATVPGRPNQKTIERSFRDLKDTIRYYATTSQSFEDALRNAINVYNKTEHRFEHFNELVIPEVLHQTIKYRQIEIDEIRTAFRERFVRVVKNNSIVIDNLTYEFFYHFEQRYGEYGRKPKLPKVVCYRDLENAQILEVWDKEEKRKLGYAQLISRDVPSLDTKELKEFKNKEKRIERRKSKLSQELEKIRQEELKEAKNEEILDITSLLNEEVKEEAPAQEETKQEEEIDILKLFID
jgi:transposase-like protein